MLGLLTDTSQTMTSINFHKLWLEEKKKLQAATPPSSISSTHSFDSDSPTSTKCEDLPPLVLSKLSSPIDWNQHRIGTIPTIHYVPDFITDAEQSLLSSHIYSQPDSRWTLLKRRRLQNWGGIPSVNGMVQEPLAPWLDAISSRLVECGVFPSSPNHVLLNEYSQGQGIMRHKDGPLYVPCVAILSLNSSAVLQFSDSLRGDPIESVFLEKRSLVVFKDQAYVSFFHGIQDVPSDTITPDVINRADIGAVIDRSTRLSLTIRIVPNIRDPEKVFDTPVAKEEQMREERFWFNAINEGDRV